MECLKHIVLIRFYCVDIMRRDIIFDDAFLDCEVSVFERFALKSLENQSCRDFTVVVLIHDEIPDDKPAIRRLRALRTPLDLRVERYGSTRSVIGDIAGDCEYLVTTRMDHDDLVYNGAAAEIRGMCFPRVPFVFNGYDRLITMVGKDWSGSRKFYPDYKGCGAINIFQSVVLNRGFSSELKYNIFSVSHVNGRPQIEKWYSDMGLVPPEGFFNVNHMEDSCVYVKHDHNHSVEVCPIFKDGWHRSSVPVGMSLEWFVERFGDFIG